MIEHEERDDQSRPEGPPPRIIFFRTHSPQVGEGGKTTLEWETANATSVSISGVGTVPQSGSREVRPEHSTTYVLTARNAAGRVTKENVRVSVMVPLQGDLPPGFEFPGQPEVTQPQHEPIERDRPEIQRPQYEPIEREQPKTMRPMPGTVRVALPPPAQVSPSPGAVLSNYPRRLKLRWRAVSGAASYTVEIDCFHCCKSGRWCTDVGRKYKEIPSIGRTGYTFNFAGAQPGRWRVWAVDKKGVPGRKSEWREFRFTR
jgi:hypothetical protein